MYDQAASHDRPPDRGERLDARTAWLLATRVGEVTNAVAVSRHETVAPQRLTRVGRAASAVSPDRDIARSNLATAARRSWSVSPFPSPRGPPFSRCPRASNELDRGGATGSKRPEFRPCSPHPRPPQLIRRERLHARCWASRCGGRSRCGLDPTIVRANPETAARADRELAALDPTCELRTTATVGWPIFRPQVSVLHQPLPPLLRALGFSPFPSISAISRNHARSLLNRGETPKGVGVRSTAVLKTRIAMRVCETCD